MKNKPRINNDKRHDKIDSIDAELKIKILFGLQHTIYNKYQQVSTYRHELFKIHNMFICWQLSVYKDRQMIVKIPVFNFKTKVGIYIFYKIMNK